LYADYVQYSNDVISPCQANKDNELLMIRRTVKSALPGPSLAPGQQN
jgi:hypothetical protein